MDSDPERPLLRVAVFTLTCRRLAHRSRAQSVIHACVACFLVIEMMFWVHLLLIDPRLVILARVLPLVHVAVIVIRPTRETGWFVPAETRVTSQSVP